MRSPFQKPFGMRSPFGGYSGNLASTLLARWADANGGLAVDFTDNSMRVIDPVTPANNYDGRPFDKLTWTGASLRMCYGSDGVLRYAPHNTWLYSNDFSNANWTKYGVSHSSGTITEDTANTEHVLIQNPVIPAGPTVTCAVKVRRVTGTRQFAIRLVAAGGADSITQYYDLTNGVLGDNQEQGVGDTNTSYTYITSLGGGEYLCVLTGRISATSSLTSGSCSFGMANGLTGGSGTYVGDGTSSVAVREAQVSYFPMHGITTTSVDYVETTSAIVYKPRIDYDPSTLAVRGLLVEEARTNVYTYSQDFDNAAWSKGECTITANAIAAPDGTTTADKIVSTANAAQHTVLQSVGPLSQNTLSVYAKAAEWGFIYLRASDAINGWTNCYFNVSTGSVGTIGAGFSNATIQSVGNGWYRCSATKTMDSSTGVIGITDVDNDDNNGTDGSGVYVWGAQLEAGAFASSYIPTTSASVTRASDAVSLATSSFNLGSAYSFYASYTEMQHSGITGIFSIDDGTTNNRADYRPDGTVIVSNGGVNYVVDTNPNINAVGTTDKVAIAIAANDFAGSVNGTSVRTDATVTMPSGITTFRLGSVFSGNVYFGHIRQIMQLPVRKPNADLVTLST